MSTLTEIRDHAHAIVDLIEKAEAAEAAAAAGQIGVPSTGGDQITVRVAQEIVEHEGIVLEAYLDVKNIWTWGLGVTNKSGHRVDRYKDKPTTLARVIEIFVWLLRNDYAPDVFAEFEGFQLTEAQFAAALSFHWNTGSIREASWCDAWKNGDIEDAKRRFMLWNKPSSIIERRQKECDLFFSGKWSQDGFAQVIPVSKPSYKPNFRKSVQVDIRPALAEALG